MKASSTISYELAHNELLRLDDEREFVDATISTLGPQPPNFKAIVALNRGPLDTHELYVGPLTPRQIEARRAAGALLVDVRTDLQYDDAHVPDAICNPAVRAGFGTKLAWVVGPDQEVVLLGRDDEDASHAAQLAAAVGVRNVAGYLAGGMTSWREEHRPTRRVQRIGVDQLHARAGDEHLQILDVRETSEWRQGHIPGSVHKPYHELDGPPDGLDPERPIAVICSSGQRSALAASLLLRGGAGEVIHVADGGVGTWARRGWATEE